MMYSDWNCRSKFGRCWSASSESSHAGGYCRNHARQRKNNGGPAVATWSEHCRCSRSAYQYGQIHGMSEQVIGDCLERKGKVQGNRP